MRIAPRKALASRPVTCFSPTTARNVSAPQLGRLVSETPPGRKVKVQYWREGKTRTTTVVPVSLQEKPGDALSPLTEMQALNVPNIPRMLMLWENLALGIECEPIDSQLAEYFGVPSRYPDSRGGKEYGRR